MKINLLILLFLSLLLYNSCNDSLGIEQNVIKKKIGNTGDTSTIDTNKPPPSIKVKASVDSVYFREEFFKDITLVIPLQAEVVKAKVFVDTSKSPPYVWLDMRRDNTQDEILYGFYNRTIYTRSVKFIADSFPASDKYRLNGSANSGYWSEIFCKTVNSSETQYLAGTETQFEISFEAISKTSILAKINAIIPNKQPDDRTLVLIGSFKINAP